MRLFESPRILKRHRRTDWEFQRTFQTPLNDLPRFVGVILSSLPEMESAIVVLDQVVFEPSKGLIPLYAKYSLPKKWHSGGVTIEAEGAAETRDLLQAVLMDWIDFLFVPSPPRFYADHDEFLTLMAHRKGHLNRVAEAFTAAKFRAVEYVRKF